MELVLHLENFVRLAAGAGPSRGLISIPLEITFTSEALSFIDKLQSEDGIRSSVVE